MNEEKQEIIEKVLAYKLEEHPTLPAPGKRQRLEMIENIGPEKVLDLFLMRENKIKAEQNDPMRYGHELPHWPDADKLLDRFNEIVVLGGNRSGKTEYAAKRMAQAFVGTDLNGQAPSWVKERYNKRNIRIWCFHTNHMTSVSAQQNVFYKYLPPEIRNIKRTNHTQISFSQKNGFSDNTAVYQNNQIWFLNYSQDIKVVEGGEVDFVWCDELVPQLWVDTLRFRLVTRRGKLIVTQTPLEGVASVYKEFSAGGRVVRWDDAELLSGKAGLVGWPTGKSARIVECMSKGRGMVFFFTSDNPYSPYDEIKSKLKEAPVGQILVRAYGWATDSIGKAFARFRADVHVIKREAIPKGGTLYMVTDPAGARNWFCLWALVYADGKMVVVREFPDLYGYGEWFLPSDKADGKVGPAQTVGAGRGTYEYRELFRTMEEDIGRGEPMMRLIDPKAGGTPALSEQGGTTLIDMLAEDGFGDAGMSFAPAPGVPVDQRMAAINSALSFDGSKPLTPINEPKLYIVDDCQNLIMALSEHVGSDGQKGASKDPIDCLGMLLTSRLEHVGPNGMQTVGGGSY